MDFTIAYFSAPDQSPLEGLLVSGPLMHYSYAILEELLPIYNENDNDTSYYHSWLMTICQVILDLLIMDSIFVATLITTSALLEGRMRDIPQELRQDYTSAVKVSWFNSFCWAPVQCLSFKYIPFHYRVLAVNLQDVAWNASVSYMAHRNRKTRDACVASTNETKQSRASPKKHL